MSIGFHFSAESNVGQWDQETVLSAIDALADRFEYSHQQEESWLGLNFCREGALEITLGEDKLSGRCYTNIAGPGFHAQVIDFLDALAVQADLELYLVDETGYYEDRDFEHMRQAHFLPWLQNLVHVVVDTMSKDEYIDMRLCWGLEEYRPALEPQTAVMPMGRYSYEVMKIILEEDRIEDFAREFYIWYNREKDGLYYRNQALSAMWMDCYFMPSQRSPEDQRINRFILDALEQSMTLDPSLSFPKKDYRLLCQLEDRPPKPVEALRNFTLFTSIGYRRDMIREEIGYFLIPIHGSFLMDYEKEQSSFVYYDNEKTNWRVARFTPYRSNETITFADIYDEPGTLEHFSFETEQTQVKASLIKTEEDGLPEYLMTSQVIHQNYMLLATFIFDQESAKQWALDTLKGIEIRPKSADEWEP